MAAGANLIRRRASAIAEDAADDDAPGRSEALFAQEPSDEQQRKSPKRPCNTFILPALALERDRIKVGSYSSRIGLGLIRGASQVCIVSRGARAVCNPCETKGPGVRNRGLYAEVKAKGAYKVALSPIKAPIGGATVTDFGLVNCGKPAKPAVELVSNNAP